MALPVTFATLPTGNEPLTALDTQFAAVGAIGVIPCAAAGQNAIALTPNANTPTISGYNDLAPSFSFAAAQTSNASVTLNVAGLGARNAYKWNGQTAIGSGDLVSGNVYKATFLTALNGGAGGFVIDTLGGSFLSSEVDFIIDGGGSTITTGIKGYLRVPIAANIIFWSVMADQPGSCVVDIFGAVGAVPTTSIVGTGNKPTLSSSQFSFATVSGWTTTFLNGDFWLGFNVVSAVTVTRVTVDLRMTRA